MCLFSCTVICQKAIGLDEKSEGEENSTNLIHLEITGVNLDGRTSSIENVQTYYRRDSSSPRQCDAFVFHRSNILSKKQHRDSRIQLYRHLSHDLYL